MNKQILLVNGPNLNLLGLREPEIYGHEKLEDIESDVRQLVESSGFELVCFQSNHEGQMVDFLQEHREAAYLIINAGAFTHTSVALRDVLAGTAIPFIEVHISNVHAREEFRHFSYLSAIAQGIIVGCGILGYQLAAELILARLKENV